MRTPFFSAPFAAPAAFRRLRRFMQFAVVLLVCSPAAFSLPAIEIWCSDLTTALETVLDAPESEKEKALEDYINDLGGSYREAGLPSSRVHGGEILYGKQHRAFRAEWMQPLKEDLDTWALVKRVILEPELIELYSELMCVVFLADNPSHSEYALLIEGFRACDDDTQSRFSRARHLGRGAAYLAEHGDAEAEALVEEALGLLRQDVDGPNTNVLGGALEGLARAGFQREAYAGLARKLKENWENRSVALLMLDNATVLMQQEEVDPFFKAWTIDRAKELAELSYREANDEIGVSRTISKGALNFRHAVSYLKDVAPDQTLGYLLRCFRDLSRATLLGMDDLQELRWSLQRYRLREDSPRSRAVDDLFDEVLVEAGESLFHLEEEPFHKEEYAAFFARRDIRYNAASYFYDMWEVSEPVRQRFASDADLPHYLHLLVRASMDDADGGGADLLYYAVAEKGETRLLAGLLLAFLERDFGQEPESDLVEFFLTFLGHELSVDDTVLDSLLNEWDGSSITFKNCKKPEDKWMKNKAIEGLALYGYDVEHDGATYTVLREEPASSP